MDILRAFPTSLRLSYRHLAYFATVLTGFASLCAQVSWQKYLTILVGSETLSINLVVAVFLAGLAAGYYVFGRLTEKKWTRWRLLKLYGYMELATAIYISVFYLYFELLKSLSFNSPRPSFSRCVDFSPGFISAHLSYGSFASDFNSLPS